MLSYSHNSRGFTMVELLIAIAVAGIMLALGVPAMSTWIGNASIRTNAEALANGIQLARTQAIQRNASVSIVLNAAGTSWTINRVSDNSLIQQRDAEGRSASVTVTPTAADGATAATTLTFTALGTVTSNADASLPIGSIKIAPSTAAANLRNMCIVVSTSGIARMCDPLRSTANLEAAGSGTVTRDPMSCQPAVPAGCL